ncbi:hypothetical protein QE390_001252 [Siphonobacter sp. SORGH_AS 1065]|nr:hypothetical protein [Siphonobacter sp. SORGH_AS_1065]
MTESGSLNDRFDYKIHSRWTVDSKVDGGSDNPMSAGISNSGI